MTLICLAGSFKIPFPPLGRNFIQPLQCALHLRAGHRRRDGYSSGWEHGKTVSHSWNGLAQGGISRKGGIFIADRCLPPYRSQDSKEYLAQSTGRGMEILSPTKRSSLYHSWKKMKLHGYTMCMGYKETLMGPSVPAKYWGSASSPKG